MSESRKTGDDYLREYMVLKIKMRSIDVHVRQRLKDLKEKFPEARYNGSVLAVASSLSDEWINTMSVDLAIHFIQGIEKWSLEQQGVVQKELEI